MDTRDFCYIGAIFLALGVGLGLGYMIRDNGERAIRAAIQHDIDETDDGINAPGVYRQMPKGANQ